MDEEKFFKILKVVGQEGYLTLTSAKDDVEISMNYRM